MSTLLNDWLYAVNQPVVDDINLRLEELMKLASDRDNFTRDQCRAILIEILQQKP